jgi:hypothetical protein
MANSTNYNLPVHQYQPAFYSGAKVRRSEVSMEYTAVTGNTTLIANTTGNSATCHYLVENTSGSNAITLPSAVGLYGMSFIVKNSANGIVTLASNGGTIDGAATQTLTEYQSLTVVSNGTNWILI